MSESEPDPLRGLLSQFSLGPAWARGGAETPVAKPSSAPSGEDRPPRRDDRDRGQFRDRGGDSRDRGGDSRGRDDRRPYQRPGQGGQGKPPHFQERREEAPPAEGVRVTLLPDPQAIHLIGREVHQVARVYALFDIAQILLAERGRCRAVFEADANRPPLFQGKQDESLFLTREEAVRHLWGSELRAKFLEEEVIEVDPPTGNFQSVARCGISGEWLGPPNFHSYQTNLRRLHRERFANMPFEVFASKVRTERGEEAVNAWLDSTRKKTRWRIIGGEEEPWFDDRAEAERALSLRCFDQAFAETRKAEISAAIPGKNLSPSLLTSLRLAGSHARRHAAILIPAVCRSLEAEHLPVFKRQGKLHTGPARPHALAPDTVLAERPAAMVAWIRENKSAKLAGLWKAVLPEGVTEPTTEYAADLFWLLHQGHILLYTDDSLVVQEPREQTPPKKAKEPKKPQAAAAAAAVATESTPEETPDSEPTPEAAIEEFPTGDELLEEPVALEQSPAPAETPEGIEESPEAIVATETPEVADELPEEPVALEQTPADPVNELPAAEEVAEEKESTPEAAEETVEEPVVESIEASSEDTESEPLEHKPEHA